jgi:hypothetical protein
LWKEKVSTGKTFGYTAFIKIQFWRRIPARVRNASSEEQFGGCALTQKRSVQLSDELCIAAERRYRDVFGNIEQLLEAVLTELVRDEAAKLDEAEHELVQQRLRELGYL